MARKLERDTIIVLVTCGSRLEAGKIAHALVRKRLAACVNVLEGPVCSIFRWKGRVESAKEIMLLVKTSRSRFVRLRREVQHLHSYDVPEIIALPIVAGSREYLAWVQGNIVSSGGQTKRRKPF